MTSKRLRFRGDANFSTNRIDELQQNDEEEDGIGGGVRFSGSSKDSDTKSTKEKKPDNGGGK